MAQNRPEKPSITLPDNFGGTQEAFSSSLVEDGYEASIPQVLEGSNLNYMLNGLFQNTKYMRTVLDYVRDTPIGKMFWVNPSGQMDYVQPSVIATNTEFNAGTATDKTPNVKQVVDKLNSLQTQVNTKINAGAASEIFKNLLSLVYPVGSIYIGTQTTCPLASIIRNSTWVLVAKDKALWTGDGANANTTIEAGLPNHTHAFGRQSTQNNGSFVWNNQNEDYVLGTQAGSIYYNGSGDYNYQKSYDAGASVNESLENTYTLSTSLAKTDNLESDGVFGNATTVQPPAYVVNVWRRVA